MNQERVRTEHTKIFKGTRDKVVILSSDSAAILLSTITGPCRTHQTCVADDDRRGRSIGEAISTRRANSSIQAFRAADADDSDSSSAEFTDSESESSDSWDDSQSESGEERRAYTNTKEEMKTACSRLRPPFLWGSPLYRYPPF